MSVAFLVLRITTHDHYWRRMLIYVSMAIHFIITVVAQVLNYAQCSPPRALWTPVPDAKCWDPKVAADLTIAQSGKKSHVDSPILLKHQKRMEPGKISFWPSYHAR